MRSNIVKIVGFHNFHKNSINDWRLTLENLFWVELVSFY